LLPFKVFSPAVRGSVKDTVAGSVLRPSDYQVPVNCPLPL
jgi:hypothetical protein